MCEKSFTSLREWRYANKFSARTTTDFQDSAGALQKGICSDDDIPNDKIKGVDV